MEDQLSRASSGWLLGHDYCLIEIKWYSMVPALPRVVPEQCNFEASPPTMQWLGEMAARPLSRSRFLPLDCPVVAWPIRLVVRQPNQQLGQDIDVIRAR
jgi:hypothetical protein